MASLDKNELRKIFKNKPIYKELKKITKNISESKDEKEIKELKEYKNAIKEFSVSLLLDVKNKKESSFEEIMNLRDMRNFLYHYSYHIMKYHNFRYSKIDVIHEIKFQVYHHIVNNYRIYNEPHEISLLIMSMRGWIRQKVSNSLKEIYHPKRDEYLETEFTEGYQFIDDKAYVFDLIDRCLNEEERLVFIKKFFDDKIFSEIGREMGVSKDTAQRRYKSALEKIRFVLEEE